MQDLAVTSPEVTNSLVCNSRDSMNSQTQLVFLLQILDPALWLKDLNYTEITFYSDVLVRHRAQ